MYLAAGSGCWRASEGCAWPPAECPRHSCLESASWDTDTTSTCPLRSSPATPARQFVTELFTDGKSRVTRGYIPTPSQLVYIECWLLFDYSYASTTLTSLFSVVLFLFTAMRCGRGSHTVTILQLQFHNVHLPKTRPAVPQWIPYTKDDNNVDEKRVKKRWRIWLTKTTELQVCSNKNRTSFPISLWFFTSVDYRRYLITLTLLQP